MWCALNFPALSRCNTPRMRARGSEGVGHGARTPGQWRATEQNQTDLICLGLFTRGEERGRGRRDRIGKGERERGKEGGREGGKLFCDRRPHRRRRHRRRHKKVPTGRNVWGIPELASYNCDRVGRDETNCSDRRVLDPFCGQRAESVAQSKSFS